MSERRRNVNRGEDKTDINISPMIDMVFILLIFFIVTTVFVDERGLDVSKPETSSEPTDPQDMEPIIVRVTERGQMTYRGELITLARLESIVEEAMAQDESLPVIFQVQRGAVASPMVMAMDHARLAGATKISLTPFD